LVSLTFVLVTLGAVFFFREPVSTQKIVGIAVIVAGIVLVASS
jgi:multidrug transporter EmrE-like cation transporter